MARNGHTEYMKTQVLTASGEQLILMLYDGALRFCDTAKQAWEADELETAHRSLIRVQDIVLELIYALDREQGGEIAENLAQLYNYCYRELVAANLERSAEKVDSVCAVFADLREAWAGAMDQVAQEGKEAGVEGQASAPAEQKPEGKVLGRVPVKQIAVPAASASSSDASGQPRSSISVQG